MTPALIALLALVMAASPASSQATDTVFVDVGSPLINGRIFKPHAARVRIYRGDTLVNHWLNELTLGDSAGRPVMRWVTTSQLVPNNPNRPMMVLRQTYDGITMAPLGYSANINNGAYTHLNIEGTQIRGRRRTAADTTVLPVAATIEKPGFFSGASDLVPVAAGLRTGTVIVSPMWSPGSAAPDYRVFKVLHDTTLMVEGAAVRARKVEERRRTDGSLYADWYLLTESPYMVYGEIPLPDGRKQRMTEVAEPIPVKK